MSLLKRVWQAITTNQSAPAPQPESSIEHHEKPTLAHILHQFEDCSDLIHKTYPHLHVDLLYFCHQIDNDMLYREVIIPLLSVKESGDMPELLNKSPFSTVTDSKKLVIGILSGQVAFFHKHDVYLADVYGFQSRNVSQSETESVITGPHDAFTEVAGTNLALIRQRIKSSHLKVVKLSVGEITKTHVYILYIQDIANMHFVNEAITRVSNIEIDAVFDTNMLLQMIDDAPYSIFPQFLTSERPDAIGSKLIAGRVVGIVDGSPSAFSAPTSFFEYFSSSDDYYERWLLGSASRLLRLLALVITITFTALYVSVTTYHYEMIPENLLFTLTESRSKVPFPPLIEALFLEITIELLREASARLPTKIAQTIGIVGGIVIGQAAVQAGLTSNILIIAVASSAIASFVIPAYVMSGSIRLLRFGLIILAGIWGNFGLAVGICAIIIHMCGLTSLGSSYLTPVAPFQIRDWKDVFIIMPFKFLTDRPTQNKSPNQIRNKMKK